MTKLPADHVWKTGIRASGDDAALEFVLSDETVDRYGDVIEAAGWALAQFRKNPIALFAHSSAFPIGTWADVRVEGRRLIARLILAARGTSPRIDELISLIQQGILRAVSVGFRPMESEPIDPKKPYEGTRYLKQELLECSVVSVPANPAALQLARSIGISPETMSLAFGEHAVTARRDLARTGAHAASNPVDRTRSQVDRRTNTKDPKMKNLAQRIEDAQADLVAKKDKLVELTGADALDNDAIDEVTLQVDTLEKTVATLKAAEAKIGADARSAAAPASVPAQVRRPLGHTEKDGMDLIVRAYVTHLVAKGQGISVDRALEQRYPGHEALGVIVKADQTLGTTGTAGWASELVQTGYFGFLQALIGKSVYPELASRGLSLMFDQFGSISLPRRTAGTAGGGFVAEGSPIRVGKITTAAATLTPKKMGVIVPFSEELAQRSTPSIEGIVRQAIIEDTVATLDPILLDATASSTSRPAGLLNGVSAAATGYAGGDYTAVREDFRALLAPFYTANGADGILVLMNPAQGLNMSLMAGPVGDPNWLQRIRDRVSIFESTNVTANRLIAVRASDFAGAGGNPRFDVSQQATIHMEDTTPLEIVSGTGPTTADPVRSLWQTASIGVRMLLDVSWTMRRTGMVQWIDTTTW